MAATQAQFGLDAGIRRLFETSQFFDIEIHCQDTVFKVHKSILACHGGFFAAISKKGFKEGDSNIIELQEEDHTVIFAMLEFMYGIEYEVPEHIEPAIFHASVYATAEFYQLPLLKNMCAEKFENITNKDQEQGAQAAFTAAEIVYSGTPETDRGLRDIVVRAVHNHMKKVIDEDDGNRSILKDVPDLAYDLVCTQASRVVGGNLMNIKCVCPGCNTTFSILNKSSKFPTDWMDVDYNFICPACSISYATDRFASEFHHKYTIP